MGRAAPPLPPDEPLAETDAPEAPAGAPEGADPLAGAPAIGLVAGRLSGLLGIGGGVIMVPAFVHFAAWR